MCRTLVPVLTSSPLAPRVTGLGASPLSGQGSRRPTWSPHTHGLCLLSRCPCPPPSRAPPRTGPEGQPWEAQTGWARGREEAGADPGSRASGAPSPGPSSSSRGSVVSSLFPSPAQPPTLTGHVAHPVALGGCSRLPLGSGHRPVSFVLVRLTQATVTPGSWLLSKYNGSTKSLPRPAFQPSLMSHGEGSGGLG